MSRQKIDKTLHKILTEADNITLDNNEFDKILNEQNAILCDINNILDKTKPEENKICKKIITKSDYKLNKMIDEFYKMHNIKKPISTLTKKKSITNKKTKNKTKKTIKNINNDNLTKRHIDVLINKPIMFMKDISPKYKLKIKTHKN